MAIRITNATAMYAIMMLVFACGMWVVLLLGATLQAQPDLAGEWELSPEGRGGPEPIRATIEQSGRFVRMRLPAKKYDLRIESSRPTIEMKGDGATAVFDPSPAPDVYRVTLETPDGMRRRYSARMIARTYPRAPAANKTQTTNLAPSPSGPTAVSQPSTHAH